MANESHQKWVKAQYDRMVHTHIFSKGDIVLVYDKDHDKLRAGMLEILWNSPYVVKSAHKKWAYDLGNVLPKPRNELSLENY